MNTIAASGADVTLSKGLVSITGHGRALNIGNIKKIVKKAYSLGVAPVHAKDLSSAVTLAAETMYTVTIVFPTLNGGTTRKYNHFAATAPTATELATALAATINASSATGVVASTSTSTLTITSNSVDNGDMLVYINKATVEGFGVTTAYVSAKGTPALLKELTGTSGATAVSNTGTYTEWEVTETEPIDAANLSGVDRDNLNEIVTSVFADASATNYAAFVTKLETALDGTLSGGTYVGVAIS